MKYIIFTLAFSSWMSTYWLTGGSLDTASFYLAVLQAIAAGLTLVIVWELYLIWKDSQQPIEEKVNEKEYR